jgi:hypothetical protein
VILAYGGFYESEACYGEDEEYWEWKAAWDRLIWKAMILKVKAIEGELNRNLRHFWRGNLR